MWYLLITRKVFLFFLLEIDSIGLEHRLSTTRCGIYLSSQPFLSYLRMRKLAAIRVSTKQHTLLLDVSLVSLMLKTISKLYIFFAAWFKIVYDYNYISRKFLYIAFSTKRKLDSLASDLQRPFALLTIIKSMIVLLNFHVDMCKY